MKPATSQPRTVKPLNIPPEQEVLGGKLAILCGHGLWDKARAVIDAEEIKWQTKRLEKIDADSPLSLVPGIKPRSVEVLDTAGVCTIRQFLSYHMTDSLRELRNVGEHTIADVLAGLRQLPAPLFGDVAACDD